MKEIEIRLMNVIKANDGRLPEQFYEGFDWMNRKQMNHILIKWSESDIWDYGVSPRTGWLTDKGRQ